MRSLRSADNVTGPPPYLFKYMFKGYSIVLGGIFFAVEPTEINYMRLFLLKLQYFFFGSLLDCITANHYQIMSE